MDNSKKRYEKYRDKYVRYIRKYRFGGNREKAIQRDGERCICCGITRKKHKEKYDRDISVDHINGKGCNEPRNRKDNRIDNLQTLCLRCHGKKDGRRKKTILTKDLVDEIREKYSTGEYVQKRLAKEYGVTQSAVSLIVNYKVWEDYDPTTNHR